MEQFELIAYHQRCAVLQARGWRRRRRGARRVELWRRDCGEVGTAGGEESQYYQLRETIMGNFPRPLLRQQPSLVVSHAGQVRFPPTRLVQARGCMSYCGRVSGGIRRLYTKSVEAYVYVTVRLGVGERDSTPGSGKLETLLIHQPLASY